MSIQETILRFIIDATLALSCLPIHEIGHYLSARLLGIKAKLVIKKFQVWHGARTDTQRIIICSGGIVAGVIPILFISDEFLRNYMLMAYLIVGCALDNIKLLRITSYYLKLDLPNCILRTEQLLIKRTHHKYCPCRNCNDYNLSKKFQFRSN